MGAAIFLLLFLLRYVSGKQAPIEPICSGGEADIVFLLDSSKSIGKGDFKKEVSFVSNFVKGFPVGPEAVQFSLVVFASRVWNQFNLKAYHSQRDLLRALTYVKYRPGLTRTGTALKFIRERSYLPSNGGRLGNRKILIVVTDGISKNPAKTSVESNLLHQDGISIISVGVGSRVKLAELRKMASNDSLVFNVENFNGLTSILGDLQMKTCMEMTEAPTLPTCSVGQADIVFLLDSSTSIGNGAFKKEISFVSNFVKGFPVGPESVQFSLVVFSSQVRNQFNFNTHQTQEDIIRALDNVTYTPGSTMTGTALKFIHEKSYLPSNGGRNGVRKILIVVTDGNSQNPAMTSSESVLLKKDEIFVISVGVGNRVKLTELREMASNESFVFNVKDFNGLTSILGDLQTATCTEMADKGKCALDALPASASMTSSICQSPSYVTVTTIWRVVKNCSGVLVGRYKVLTTASCIKNTRVYSVTLGESGSATQRLEMEVESATVHPAHEDKGHDIAVLKLKKPVTYTECILPACLSTPRKQCEPLEVGTCNIDRWAKGIYPSKAEVASTGASYLSPELCAGVFFYGKNEIIPSKTVCVDDHGIQTVGDGEMVSCIVNNKWTLYSLVTSPSMDDFPALGVDLRDPDILEFINSH